MPQLRPAKTDAINFRSHKILCGINTQRQLSILASLKVGLRRQKRGAGVEYLLRWYRGIHQDKQLILIMTQQSKAQAFLLSHKPCNGTPGFSPAASLLIITLGPWPACHRWAPPKAWKQRLRSEALAAATNLRNSRRPLADSCPQLESGIRNNERRQADTVEKAASY